MNPKDALKRTRAVTEPRTVSLSRSGPGVQEPSTLDLDPGARPPAVRPTRIGGYEILSELGRGGMGVVYRARDEGLNREVALKVLSSGHDLTPVARQRFLREARATASLRHPNIIEVWSFGEDEGHTWFAMRVIEGASLLNLLAERGRLPPREAAALVAKVARALSYAHSQGLVHRDVKSANILLDAGEPLLADFGLVTELDDTGESLTRHTQILGTPSYLAPELIEQGATAASEQSDLYALGVVLYECLAGRRPFVGPTPNATLLAICTGTPTPLESLGVPPALARIVRRAMARRPAERFVSVEEFARVLEAWIGGEISVSRVSDLRRRGADRWRQGRSSAARLSLAVGAVVLASWGARGLWAGVQERGRHAEAEARRQSMETRVGELNAAGQTAEADAVFEAFVALPEHRDTPALSSAWRARGEHHAAAGDLKRALNELATAYATADALPEQEAALGALVNALYEADDWRRLSATLAVLDALPASSVAPAQGIRRDLALARRDMAEALARAEPGLAPLVTALSQVTATEIQATLASAWDLDEDGAPEIALYREQVNSVQHLADAHITLSRATPALTPIATPPFPWASGGWNIPRPVGALLDAERLALVPDGDDCVLISYEGGALVERDRWGCPALTDAAAGDLDGDGQPEIYVSTDRRLQRAVRGPDGRMHAAILPGSTSHANSEIHDLAVRDLDGDGRPELAATLGRWGAYDLRVLGPDGEGLALRARFRVGDVLSSTPLHAGGEDLIAVAIPSEPAADTDTRAFGPGKPSLLGRGVHLLALEGETLALRGQLRLPNSLTEARIEGTALPHAPGHLPVAGDLDGDGDDEVVFTDNFGAGRVFDRQPDGSWRSLPLPGLYPLLAADLDGDGDDELIASEWGSLLVWVVGAGDDRYAAIPEGEVTPAAPPPGLGASERARWRRAEQLVALDMPEPAVERFQALAREGVGTPTEPLAWRRAAELLEAQGALEQASATWMLAASEPSQRALSLEAAWRTARRNLDWARALAAAEARVALPDPPAALSDDLQTLRRLTQPLDTGLDLREGVPASAALLSPWAAHFDLSAGGLRVRGAGQLPLLEVKLRRADGPARVRLTLRPVRADWGSRLALEIAPAGSAAAAPLFTLSGYGGGGHTFLSPACPVGLARQAFTTLEADQLPEADLTLSLEFSPDEPLARFTLQRGQETTRWVLAEAQKVIPDGGSVLRLRSSSDHLSMMEFVIKKIEFSGVEIIPADPSPLTQALAQLARNEAGAALQSLGEAQGVPARLTRAEALERLDARDPLDRELRALAAAGEEAREALRQALLLETARLAPALQRALGDDYLPLALASFEVDRVMHADRESVRAQMLSALVGLPLRGSAADPPAQLLERLQALTLRASLTRASGRISQATRDLADATALAAAVAARVPPGEERSRALLDLALERARQALAQSDAEAALDALHDAVQTSLAPEVQADRLAVDPAWAPLHAQPRWQEVIDARRLSPGSG